MKTRIKLYNSVRIITSIFITTFILASACSDDMNNPEGSESSEVIIRYNESFESFPNPERGFLHLNPVFSEGSPLSNSSLSALREDNISLVWRLYYFEKFKDQELSANQLALIESDMNLLRQTGIKCVLRFAYTNNGDDGTDASIEWVEKHLDQLKPIFDNHSDVIAFVNAGFIGLWGEWHSSTNNLTSTANRQRIITKLLEVLPSNIKIQIRTPKHKKEVFGVSTALTDENGYSEDGIARVGHHNDCFMASSTDYGTYQNPVADKAYISQEAFYVPTGGETCPPSGVPQATCETGLETMTHLKWTYLNLDWYKPIIDGWKNNGCFQEFERDMGYRIRLDSTIADTIHSKSTSWSIKIALTNVGWAPVYNTKDVVLVLQNQDNEETIDIPIDIDIRRAIPNATFAIEGHIDVSSIELGTYDVLLKITDQYESISDRPEFSIRLANENTWISTSGHNDLQLTVEMTD